MRNDQLYSLAGEVPAQHCWPEIWITHPVHEERARQLLQDWQQTDIASDLKEWVCSNCQETIEPQFAQCWQCGQLCPP